jgi:hypothetical protein
VPLWGFVLLLLLTGIALYGAQFTTPQHDDEASLEHDLTYYPPIWVTAMAKAIAVAEGFGVHGAKPTRQNNPGDLTVEGTIWTFQSETEGWNALYRQLELMFDNRSHVYNSEMTLREVADKWTETEKEAWANNVANQLSTTPEATLDQVKTQYGG